jgi:hypothetical protein
MTDAIDALGQSLAQTQASFDAAATKLAESDLPSAIVPDPTNLGSPKPGAVDFGVDPAQQLITMIVAADTHHVNAAAMRIALSTYQDSVDLVNTDS